MTQSKILLLQLLRQQLQGNTQVANDPAKAIYTGGSSSFDHQRAFGFMDAPGFSQAVVNRDNIQTAATLFGIGVIGLEMGVFRTVDAVLKDITLGRFDVSSTATAKRVHDYFFLRANSRLSIEEMQLHCNKVFGRSTFNFSGDLPPEMVTNDNFSQLWGSLMEEVIRFIGKFEQADNPQNVSRSSIRQVVIDLQQNLSHAASGMAKLMVPGMYAHLEDAVHILDADEVKTQVGFGVARDVWNVVKAVNARYYDTDVNTSSLLELADAGRDILLDIADYDTASFSDARFLDFIRRVESFIVAQGQLVNNDGARPQDAKLVGGEEDAEYEMVGENPGEDWNF